MSHNFSVSQPPEPVINESNMEIDDEAVFGIGGLQPEAEEEGGEEEGLTEEGLLLLNGTQPSVPTPTPTIPAIATPIHTKQPITISLKIRQAQEFQSGVPFWDPKRVKKEDAFLHAVPIDETVYHPVVLDEWESRILWDSPESDR